MNILGLEVRRAETRSATVESPSVALSSDNILSFFGIEKVALPHVTISNALTVPAVFCAVAFLSRTLAAIPLHAFRRTAEGAERLSGDTALTISEFPNEEMDGFKMRQYFWQQVFTGGRGLAWIERKGDEVVGIWPMDPRKVSVKRVNMRLVYTFDGKRYPAADVIDVPFMLKEDMIGHDGPINKARKAIQLALAMGDYGSNFFAGGGVPPLALSGPLPQGADGLKRAMADMTRAIDAAKSSQKPVFPIPPGHELKQVGFDPAKGQMTEARLFQIQEFSRVWQLPPVFLHDLSHGIRANVEQQDLSLIKHLLSQWVKAFEGEANLKLFGRKSRHEVGGRYVEHNLAGLMRGDFKTRIEGIARGIQTGQLTPNEARELENRPRHSNPAADELLVQGATVVLGSAANGAGVPPPEAPSESQADDGEVDADKT
ncbi:phage portal protein [Paracoccus aminophilus JCM 7686]|uniref:Phage portal protein n=1 Tax=Paracoccus aminophilus JCM 7686 TaxID=1367847 RepID=S5XVM0_PARAH|nr:phage portal protein [Paracoccus aminophilus JCM 7686]AGT10565.1 phage portal protein [Paracoccus aminophilus JCM 7686]